MIIGGRKEIGQVRVSGDHQVRLSYLRDSDLELADPADEVRGMVAVDPHGHRLGVVNDLIVDVEERRARLLSVTSGGIVGLDTSERLIPVEMVSRIDDRVHVDRSHEDVHAHSKRVGAAQTATSGPDDTQRPDPSLVEELCSSYGVRPSWVDARPAAYFRLRRPTQGK